MNENKEITTVQKIAIQGFEGSFHQIAAEGYFDKTIEIVPCPSFADLTDKCSDSSVTDGGVMAIENSIAGSILPNYQLLQNAELYIKGEIYLPISQHLMAIPGQTVNDIKEVRSHPMAIYQCLKYLKCFPEIKRIEAVDTALSAKHVRDGSLMGVAAIASKRAAELYGLEIIAPNIETVRNNFTRFLILGRQKNEWDKTANKASIYFGLKHQPGSLAKALIALANINISKIQSFPVIKKEWEYFFHLDLEFENIAHYNEGLEALKSHCNTLRVLGIYQKGMTL